MSNRKELIKKLEERNSELAKEILLNESATYEANKELRNIDVDLLDHPSILEYISEIKQLIEKIHKRNEVYRTEIFENELEINKLRNEEE